MRLCQQTGVGLRVAAELALSALRAKHMQLVVDVRVGAPLVGRVLVLARRTAALGADERCFGSRIALQPAHRRAGDRGGVGGALRCISGSDQRQNQPSRSADGRCTAPHLGGGGGDQRCASGVDPPGQVGRGATVVEAGGRESRPNGPQAHRRRGALTNETWRARLEASESHDQLQLRIAAPDKNIRITRKLADGARELAYVVEQRNERSHPGSFDVCRRGATAVVREASNYAGQNSKQEASLRPPPPQALPGEEPAASQPSSSSEGEASSSAARSVWKERGKQKGRLVANAVALHGTDSARRRWRQSRNRQPSSSSPSSGTPSPRG